MRALSTTLSYIIILSVTLLLIVYSLSSFAQFQYEVKKPMDASLYATRQIADEYASLILRNNTGGEAGPYSEPAEEDLDVLFFHPYAARRPSYITIRITNPNSAPMRFSSLNLSISPPADLSPSRIGNLIVSYQASRDIAITPPEAGTYTLTVSAPSFTKEYEFEVLGEHLERVFSGSRNFSTLEKKETANLELKEEGIPTSHYFAPVPPTEEFAGIYEDFDSQLIETAGMLYSTGSGPAQFQGEQHFNVSGEYDSISILANINCRDGEIGRIEIGGNAFPLRSEDFCCGASCSVPSVPFGTQYNYKNRQKHYKRLYSVTRAFPAANISNFTVRSNVTMVLVAATLSRNHTPPEPVAIRFDIPAGTIHSSLRIIPSLPDLETENLARQVTFQDTAGYGSSVSKHWSFGIYRPNSAFIGASELLFAGDCYSFTSGSFSIGGRSLAASGRDWKRGMAYAQGAEEQGDFILTEATTGDGSPVNIYTRFSTDLYAFKNAAMQTSKFVLDTNCMDCVFTDERDTRKWKKQVSVDIPPGTKHMFLLMESYDIDRTCAYARADLKFIAGEKYSVYSYEHGILCYECPEHHEFQADIFTLPLPAGQTLDAILELSVPTTSDYCADYAGGEYQLVFIRRKPLAIYTPEEHKITGLTELSPAPESISLSGTGNVTLILEAVYSETEPEKVLLPEFGEAKLTLSPLSPVRDFRLTINGEAVLEQDLEYPKKISVSSFLVGGALNTLDFQAESGLLEWKLILS